jgi:ornithine cyclodeaminase
VVSYLKIRYRNWEIVHYGYKKMRTLGLDAIRKTLQGKDLLPAIEAGFAAYSEGRAVVPPVGELLFKDPPGDVHIKYGYIVDDDYFVIKIASGFYQNPRIDLPSGNGMMLLFDQKTGMPLCILLSCPLPSVAALFALRKVSSQHSAIRHQHYHALIPGCRAA